MADLRRQTMRQSDVHGLSRLPMPPPSAIKPTSQFAVQQNLRASLAPGMGPPSMRQSIAGGGALKMSSMGPPPAPGSVSRPSAYWGPNANPLLASVSKKTPLNKSTIRRGSVAAPRSMMGMATPSGGAAVGTSKDPRQLREKAVQSLEWEEMSAWARQTGFEGELKKGAMTGQMFRAIFEHLVIVADPAYAFPAPEYTRDKGKWEPEFMAALSYLRYPWVSSIDIKWLATVAAPHSWPQLLGMLHWLVELGKARISALESGHPSLQDETTVPDDFDEDVEDYHMALAFEYYARSYENFLDNGAEEFAEQEQELAGRYAKKNEQILNEVSSSQKLLERLDAEREDLMRNKPEIEKLRHQQSEALNDKVKYQDFVARLITRRDKAEAHLRNERKELQIREGEITTLVAELEGLEKVVQQQNLSPEEVIRMNTDHEALTQSIKELGRRIAESRSQIMALEVAVANRGAAAEEAVDTYTGLLFSLQLDQELALELNTAADAPEELLVGADVRSIVRPSLNRLAEESRRERARVESEKLGIEHLLDGLVADCENEEAQIAAVARDIAKLTDEADVIREAATAEADVNDRRAEELEAELAQAKHAAKVHGVGAKSRLQTLQIAEQEQIEKVARLREETGRAIMKNSGEIAKFKTDISNLFSHLQHLADTN